MPQAHQGPVLVQTKTRWAWQAASLGLAQPWLLGPARPQGRALPTTLWDCERADDSRLATKMAQNEMIDGLELDIGT